MDAEKAFDWVEWEYLWEALRRFGFGEGFIGWVQLLYQAPVASVCTNRVRSEYFRFHQGTRQGCPLSPLLFAPCDRAAGYRAVDFKELWREGTEHRVLLYADDLLLYISDPLEGMGEVMQSLRDRQFLWVQAKQEK